MLGHRAKCQYQNGLICEPMLINFTAVWTYRFIINQTSNFLKADFYEYVMCTFRSRVISLQAEQHISFIDTGFSKLLLCSCTSVPLVVMLLFTTWGGQRSLEFIAVFHPCYLDTPPDSPHLFVTLWAADGEICKFPARAYWETFIFFNHWLLTDPCCFSPSSTFLLLLVVKDWKMMRCDEMRWLAAGDVFSWKHHLLLMNFLSCFKQVWGHFTTAPTFGRAFV